MASKKLNREEFRKQKELEDARKAGTAPAEVDEDGKDINPHIPQYISTVPWYWKSESATLKHQRPQKNTEEGYAKINEWYKKGVNTASVAKKFRKGACENCGAMGHNKKDCFERPRKVGAKYTNKNIAPDDWKQPELNLSFYAKRDNWAGYDPADHKAAVEKKQQFELQKRKLQSQNAAEDGSSELTSSSATKKARLSGADENEGEVEGEGEREATADADRELDSDDDDEFKYVDGVDMIGTKVDNKHRITVRNLRIREDTAKYLYNLDSNSAYYDPKTRSMRENPHTDSGIVDPHFKGDNFVRHSGDTIKHTEAQMFAWDVNKRGVNVHLLAEPTKSEQLQKQFQEKKEVFKHEIKQSIFDRYGGQEYLKSHSDSLA